MVRSLLVTGSDTGIGKTWVVAALVRLLAAPGRRVQVVKVVETGRAEGEEGDAACACRLGGGATPITLASFPLALAPATAAAAAGRSVALAELLAAAAALPECDWRIYEGAGGIASPIDAAGRDWGDFAAGAGVEAVVLVVPDRLGAINQARLVWGRAQAQGLNSGIWLNAAAPREPAVAASNRRLLRGLGVPLWAEQAHAADLPEQPESVRDFLLGPPAVSPAAGPASGGRDPLARFQTALAERDGKQLRRVLRVTARRSDGLNLADNDYLALAQDPAVIAAAAAAVVRDGTSASASPLVTGWKPAHSQLVKRLCAWHGFSSGLLWSSGYAANAAVLGTLPAAGDLILADRLIHHSMVAGLRRSGARWQRYPHLDLDRLEALLKGETRPCWVVTESLFSMDGDFPDLRRLAELKGRYGFWLVLDEAHALGWYGPEGAGLARAAGIAAAVDVFVATLGKTLASGGAYTLFHDETVRDYLLNTAGEFIYSTALPPAAAAAAEAALDRVVALAPEQPQWHELSREFRRQLAAAGWSVPPGDSPIIPVRLDDEDQALGLAEALRAEGIQAAAVRPPTVPAGTSRLRFSLKRGLRPEDLARVVAAMGQWRKRR